MKKFHYGILSVPFVLIVWLIVSSQYSALVFPGPLIVLKAFIKELGQPSYYHAIGISLYRLMFGFIIALVSAFIVGTIAGISQAFRQFITPIVTFFQATPPMAWAPLLILMLNLGNAPMIAVIVIAAFFPIVVNVIRGMEMIRESHVRAANALGASRLQLAFHMYLPAVFPAAFTGILVGFGIAWRALVAAEMIGGSAGLGWLIASSGQIGNSQLVMVGIISIGLLAMFFEYGLLRPLQKKFADYKE